jgi:hypothetical protein
MIGRRDLIASGTALAAMAPTVAMALPQDLAFEVMRDGSRVGTHRIAFRQNGNDLVAANAVEIVVRLGPIALFRYTHSAREVWRDGQFQQLKSETNDDGKRLQVSIARDADKVVVDVPSQPRAIMPPDTIPLTHWNVLCMRNPLINPEDGVPITSRVVAHGDDMVASVGGRMISARHYSLVGKVALDDWYDVTPLWTALRTKAHDGSMVEYRRTA